MKRLLIMMILFAGCAKKESATLAPTESASQTSSAKSSTQNPAPSTGGFALSAADQEALFDAPVKTIDGEDTTLATHRGKKLLIANVASQCGLTNHYEGLQEMQKTYGDKDFTVLGFPCNQFGGQEPGTEAEIKAFCTSTYGVSFPLFSKIEVNGANRHPIYSVLTKVPNQDGEAGDIQWNFEKFVVSKDGTRVHRFAPRTKPLDEAIVRLIR